MSERRFGQVVGSILKAAPNSLNQEQLKRLDQARSAALAAFVLASKKEKKSFVKRVLSSVLGEGAHAFVLQGVRFALPLLVVGFVASYAWKHQEQLRVQELVELDVALLDDDLPLEAYQDQGFAAFLNSKVINVE